MGDAVPYDAVLLIGFGGPEGQDDVIPFLRNVTRGRGIPAERLEEVAGHYRAFGGVSPVNGQNRELRAALELELTARGSELPVYWGNRNWAPLLADTVAEAAAAGHQRLIAIATSAYSSYSSCRQYLEDIARVAPSAAVSIAKIAPYFSSQGFLLPFAEGLSAALAEVASAGIDVADTHVFFSTHSIPTTDAAASGPVHSSIPGGAYVAQHLGVAEAVMDEVDSAAPWSLAYQSRSGPPAMPWLEPDINDAIRDQVAAGSAAVIIVPIGFVSDHMEVKWDLDTEALDTARQLGVMAIRVATPGVHPAFVSALVDLVLHGHQPNGVDAFCGTTFCGESCCIKAARR